MIKEIKLKTKTSNDLKESFPLDINGKTFTSAKDLYTVYKDEFDYLFELQQSGVTNMFGSPAYVESEFNISSKEARQIVSLWMNHYEELKNSFEYKESTNLDLNKSEKKMNESFDYSSRGSLQASIKTFSNLISFCSEKDIDLSDIVDYCDQRHVVYELQQKTEESNYDYLYRISQLKDIDLLEDFFEIDGYGYVKNITQEKLDMYIEEVLDMFEDNGGMYNESVETNKELIKEEIETLRIIGYGWNEDSEQFTDVEDFEYEGDLETVKDKADAVAHRLHKYYDKSYVEITKKDGTVLDKISYDEVNESKKLDENELTKTTRELKRGDIIEVNGFRDWVVRVVYDFEHDRDNPFRVYTDERVYKANGRSVWKIIKEPDKKTVKSSNVEEKLEDNKSVVDKVKEPRKPTQKGKAKVTSLSPRK